MKKLLILMFALLLMLTFASCGGEPMPQEPTVPTATPEVMTPEVVTPDVVTPETPTPPEVVEWESLTVEERLYKHTGVASFDSHRKWYIFNSKQELDAFYEAHDVSLGKEFVSFCEKYDDAYFADRSLICVGFHPYSDILFGGATQFLKGGSRYYLTTSYKIATNYDDLMLSFPEPYTPVLAIYEPEAGCKLDESDFTLYWEEGYFEIIEGYPD